ncbi:hypothetical protein [Thermoflavimicrobium dichotomicum]|uniref:Uncharacterized protein n=1 Tax=Thermoflavimicrobium dichotomicum TaxID=46223 RepID=A0A1I3MGK5_9BACL|nr:hypothetical protein [Thermoflavimicrobium dichotomicum]SFI95930.1 hypothetical protein SAMN05421852_10355 [Thermoflavimicrobium dichotomicum]
MLKLRVMGSPFEVHTFINHVQSDPQYKVEYTTEIYKHINHENEAIAFANLEFSPTRRDELVVKISTADNKECEICLLDGQVVKMGDHITLISGKVYDVFS